MKRYAFCGHKWSYSRVSHIRQLDEWAKGHWKGKLKKAPPMITEGRIDENKNRFYHNTKRTISFIQLHKTKFTKFCIKLLSDRKLPAPTQDTFMFYVANRFDPHTVGTKNFKKDFGFMQGNGRRGVEEIRKRIAEVDAANPNQPPISPITQEIPDINVEFQPQIELPDYAKIPEEYMTVPTEIVTIANRKGWVTPFFAKTDEKEVIDIRAKQ
jgi:hypothetical protein